MDEERFNGLIESVKQGGAILRGEQPASRIFVTQDDPRYKELKAAAMKVKRKRNPTPNKRVRQSRHY